MTILAFTCPVRGADDAALFLRNARETLDAAARSDCVRFVVAIDFDQAELASVLASGGGPWMHIHMETRATLGTLHQRCYEAVEADAYINWAADFACVTPGWDDRIRDALATPYTIPHFVDPSHERWLATSAVITRDVARVAGMYMPTWWPYWFTDTWVSEVAELAQCRVPLHGLEQRVSQGPVGNRPDLAIWGRLFHATRRVRMRIAERLIEAGEKAQWDRADHWHLARLEAMHAIALGQADRTRHLLDPAFIRRWGGPTRDEPHYRAALDAAVTYMRDMYQRSQAEAA